MTCVDYLRPNRTIETLRISNNLVTKNFFVFNHEGLFFRIFKNKEDAYNSASGKTNDKIIAEFTNEKELDIFLERYLSLQN